MAATGKVSVTVVEGLKLGAAAAAAQWTHQPKGKKAKRKHGKAKAAVPAGPEGGDSPPAAAASGGGGVANPRMFVQVSVGSQVQSTEVKPSVNPTWDETLMFPCTVPPDDVVVLSVLNQDASAATSLLGAVEIKLSDLLGGNEISKWYKLDVFNEDATITQNGSIFVRAKFEAAPAAAKDSVDAVVEKLSGPRPSLLRVGYAYSTVKSVYGYAAGLPLLRTVAPVFESAVETVLVHTPLKPSPEGGEAQKATANLDKSITSALAAGDGKVDAWKDWALDCVKSGKDKVKGLKPEDKSVVQASLDGIKHGASSAKDSVTGATCSAYSSVTGFVGGIVYGTLDRVSGAYRYTTDATSRAASSTYSGAKDTAHGAYSAASGLVGGAYGKAAGLAGSTYDAAAGLASGVYSKVASVAGGVYGATLGRVLGSAQA